MLESFLFSNQKTVNDIDRSVLGSHHRIVPKIVAKEYNVSRAGRNDRPTHFFRRFASKVK